jgi:hypothetical protein
MREQREQLRVNTARMKPQGRKARLITDVTSTAHGKEEWQYACRLFRRNSLKEGAIWNVDPLLGNDRKISDYTTAFAK